MKNKKKEKPDRFYYVKRLARLFKVLASRAFLWTTRKLIRFARRCRTLWLEVKTFGIRGAIRKYCEWWKAQRDMEAQLDHLRIVGKGLERPKGSGSKKKNLNGPPINFWKLRRDEYPLDPKYLTQYPELEKLAKSRWLRDVIFRYWFSRLFWIAQLAILPLLFLRGADAAYDVTILEIYIALQYMFRCRWTGFSRFFASFLISVYVISSYLHMRHAAGVAELVLIWDVSTKMYDMIKEDNAKLYPYYWGRWWRWNFMVRYPFITLTAYMLTQLIIPNYTDRLWLIYSPIWVCAVIFIILLIIVKKVDPGRYVGPDEPRRTKQQIQMEKELFFFARMLYRGFITYIPQVFTVTALFFFTFL